jgi:hypothetical protein
MKRQLVLPALLLTFAAAGCAGDDKSKPDATAAMGPRAGSSSFKAAAMGSSTMAPLSPADRQNDRLSAYVDSARRDLSDGKVTLINEVMTLSSEESAKFWPIYHAYEEELFALGDRRVEMTRQFLNAQSMRTFDDAAAAALAKEWFDVESQRLDLVKRYHDEIAEELSPLRAVQFTQIEHRVGTVVDLILASDLPLVRTDPARPDAGSK